MGALTSRQQVDAEEAEFIATHAYRFPPKSGKLRWKTVIYMD